MEQKHVVCEISESKTLSLSEIIMLALAHDLGANHLEEFNNCKPLEFTVKNIQSDFCEVEAELIEIIVFLIIEGDYPRHETDDASKHIFKNQSLRAPPSTS